jgi:hypothetical protein
MSKAKIIGYKTYATNYEGFVVIVVVATATATP